TILILGGVFMIKQIFFIIILLSATIITLGCTNNTEEVNILEGTDAKNTVESETRDISLTQIHQDNFEKYAESGNEQLLKNLSPTDIFKYYYQAYKLDDAETLYNLCIK